MPVLLEMSWSWMKEIDEREEKEENFSQGPWMMCVCV
jgi:hypothetical protein